MNRELRRQCRLRKTAKVAEVVSSESIHQAVKRFAPKQQRRRLQLRSAEGHLQSHEAEHRQMVQYFVKLYADTPCDHATLSRSIHITTGEVTQAMQRIRPVKAMPSVCAASSLWKLVCGDVIPILVEQFRRCLQVGASGLPPRWSCSELVLLPKPGKPMTHPSKSHGWTGAFRFARIFADIQIRTLVRVSRIDCTARNHFPCISGPLPDEAN